MTLKKKKKIDKRFDKLASNSVFGRTEKNIRKHREFKFVTTLKNKFFLVLKIIIVQSFSQKIC